MVNEERRISLSLSPPIDSRTRIRPFVVYCFFPYTMRLIIATRVGLINALWKRKFY